MSQLPVLKLGKHEPRYPLIQGGMGVAISGPKLAGHVARCGGVGTIASVGLACNTTYYNGKNYFEANQLAVKDGIREAREIAGPAGVIAVNCMVALTDYDRHVRSACEGGVDVIISGAGLPLRLTEYAKDYPDVALVPIVSSVKAVSLITRRWRRPTAKSRTALSWRRPNTPEATGVLKMEQVNDDDFS